MKARTQNANPVLMTVGLDIGKDVFHIVGFDADGKIALRRKIKRLALAVACHGSLILFVNGMCEARDAIGHLN